MQAKTKPYRIAFSVKERRPGCAIIQAAYGGNVPDFSMRFGSETWLLIPDESMRLFAVDETELKQLVTMAEIAVRKKPKTRRT